MRKILFFIFILLSSTSILSSADKMYGKGQGFVGAEVGFGGVADLNTSAIGGYQYYFKDAWQFAGFRHGVRGIGSIGFGRYDGSFNKNYSLLTIGAGADWTIEFMPHSKYNWGAFVGVGIVYINGINKDSNYSLDSVVGSVNIGGSLNIDNTHKLEVGIGSGPSLIAFRYIYMF